MRDRLGAKPLPIQLPIGSEDSFVGVVDLIEDKALVWKDELGTEFEYGEVPGDLKEAAHEARTHLIEACADYDDELMEMYLDEQEIPHERIARSLHRATLDIKVTPVLSAPRSRTRACSRCWTRSSSCSPRRSRCRRCRPSRSRSPATAPVARRSSARRRQCAVCRPCLQGDGRPLRRQAHLLPRLLGQAQRRQPGPELQQRADRADRPPADDARQPSRGGRGGLRRRHRRRGRPQADLHRRHALGTRRPGRSWRRSSSPSL